MLLEWNVPEPFTETHFAGKPVRRQRARYVCQKLQHRAREIGGHVGIQLGIAMQRSRSFGLCRCRRTLRCCNQSSPLTNCTPATETLGGSSFGSVAQPLSSAAGVESKAAAAMADLALAASPERRRSGTASRPPEHPVEPGAVTGELGG